MGGEVRREGEGEKGGRGEEGGNHSNDPHFALNTVPHTSEVDVSEVVCWLEGPPG